MTIRETLKMYSGRLAEKGFASPLLEVEGMLSLVLNKGKEFFYAHPEKPLSLWEGLRFSRLFKKRLKGWSLSHLSGHRGFYGFDFSVNGHTLIPRPETELMVDEVLKEIGGWKSKYGSVIDVGTGSGCIVVSLAKKIKEIGGEFDFFGIDISNKALAMARKNAKKNGVSDCIKFLHSDLLNVIDFKELKKPILIVANLPYLTPKQVKNSPSIKKEPRIALVSGKDGLEHYRRLFKGIAALESALKSGMIVFCEIDETQGKSFSDLVHETIPEATLTVKKDLSGFDRLAVLDF